MELEDRLRLSPCAYLGYSDVFIRLSTFRDLLIALSRFNGPDLVRSVVCINAIVGALDRTGLDAEVQARLAGAFFEHRGRKVQQGR